MILKKGDRGSLVSLLQLALERSGYLNSQKDGIFGDKTEAALRRFQADEGISADGIAGRETMLRIKKYITGYTTYTIKSGDTLYNLARQFYSTVPLIETANPDIFPENLTVGENIIIPYSFKVVPTDIPYSSLLTELVIEGLVARYPFLMLSTVGRSVMGKRILMLTVGKGEKTVFANASHHANEWITTPLLLAFIENFSIKVINAGYIAGYSAEEIFNSRTLYAVPLVNPDGVDLVTDALDKNSPFYKEAYDIGARFPDIPFPNGWKANIKGTDLNLNYPADWQRARELKFAAGFNQPAPRDYVGTAPLSAIETKNMFSLTLREDFDITISLHTQGEEIYWQFKNYATEESRRLGELMADVSRYLLTSPPEFSNYAGYKDWFLQNYRRPAYTVEAGRGQNPLPITDFTGTYPKIEAIMCEALVW